MISAQMLSQNCGCEIDSLGRLFNGACGSLLRGFATMGSDEDTRRGTSPEKVNEYRREVWERWCYSAVWMKAIGHSTGQSSELWCHGLFTGSFSPPESTTTRCLYTGRGKKGKAALSIELLINDDWIGRILSGIMITGIVRYVAYRDLIYGITAALFVFVSYPNCFVLRYNGIQRQNNAK